MVKVKAEKDNSFMISTFIIIVIILVILQVVVMYFIRRRSQNEYSQRVNSVIDTEIAKYKSVG